nr:MAG: wsv045-like protein [Chiromantes dehaani nimavirus]
MFNICNPLLKVSSSVSVNNGTTQVTFAIKVDDKSGVSQTAILMLALDSFMSLVASSKCADVNSNKEDSTFVIRVPYNASGEILLNNKGFPAGLCGPFRRWSLNFKSANLSGKNGIAGIAAAALANTKDGFDVNGTGILERMNIITAATQQLDDSEMGRTLSRNRRSGPGSRFSVSSTRQTNQRDLLRYQNLHMKAIGEMQIKEEVATGEREEEEEVEEEENDRKKSTRKRSRRKGDCTANPLSFVDKFVGNVRTLGIKGCSQPPPSDEFTSLFMTGAEADACYQTCQSMRGASRVKSLLTKYGHKDLMKENKQKTRWQWSSPETRKLVVVTADGSERILTFRIVCEKSERFNTVTSMASDIKQWIRNTAKFLDDLNELKDFLLHMGSAASYLKVNLLKTLAGVLTVRDTVGFRIPDHSKKWFPKAWNAPMSTMGITSCRYDKVIEVMDLLITGGAFVTSCLNNAYFYERGVKPRNSWWLHIDALKLATVVLKHTTKTGNDGGNFCSSPSSTPIVITDGGIAIKKIESTSKPSPPTRQSIDATISTIIQNFSDISSALRERGIQRCLSKNGKVSLDDVISRLGAFKALMETTVTADDRFLEAQTKKSKKRKAIQREDDDKDEDDSDSEEEEEDHRILSSAARRYQLRIEAIRKSAATTALIFTRPALDNAMSLKLTKRLKF